MGSTSNGESTPLHVVGAASEGAVSHDREFPVLWPHDRAARRRMEKAGCPHAVPWEMVAPHEAQALKNHDQTLARLAERGGLSPSELVAVLRDQGLKFALELDSERAVDVLLIRLAAWGRG